MRNFEVVRDMRAVAVDEVVARVWARLQANRRENSEEGEDAGQKADLCAVEMDHLAAPTQRVGHIAERHDAALKGETEANGMTRKDDAAVCDKREYADCSKVSPAHRYVSSAVERVTAGLTAAPAVGVGKIGATPRIMLPSAEEAWAENQQLKVERRARRQAGATQAVSIRECG